MDEFEEKLYNNQLDGINLKDLSGMRVGRGLKENHEELLFSKDIEIENLFKKAIEKDLEKYIYSNNIIEKLTKYYIKSGLKVFIPIKKFDGAINIVSKEIENVDIFNSKILEIEEILNNIRINLGMSDEFFRYIKYSEKLKSIEISKTKITYELFLLFKLKKN
jgi:hypothetical protein